MEHSSRGVLSLISYLPARWGEFDLEAKWRGVYSPGGVGDLNNQTVMRQLSGSMRIIT